MKIENGHIVFENLIEHKTGKNVRISTDGFPLGYIRESASKLGDNMKEILDEPQTEFPQEEKA